jgi:hypothetical protein
MYRHKSALQTVNTTQCIRDTQVCIYGATAHVAGSVWQCGRESSDKKYTEIQEHVDWLSVTHAELQL